MKILFIGGPGILSAAYPTEGESSRLSRIVLRQAAMPQ
jgi:hypothetical protein